MSSIVPSLTPSLTLEDLAALRIISNGCFILPLLYKKLRCLEYDSDILKTLFYPDLTTVVEKTKLLCYIAVVSNSNSLEHVPDIFKTKELYKIAVTSCASAMDYIDENFKTPELNELALTHDYGHQYVSMSYITYERFLNAVKNSGWSVIWNRLPEHFLTEEMYIAGVTENADSIKEIPIPSVTKNICKAAIIKDGSVIEYIIDNFKQFVTQDLCDLAVNSIPDSIRWIPKKNKTLELCRIAIKYNQDNLVRIPKKFHQHCYFSIEL